jgi:hypothetical protein
LAVVWVSLKLAGVQDYLTGNVFRDCKQGFSGFKGSQGQIKFSMAWLLKDQERSFFEGGWFSGAYGFGKESGV